MVRPLASSFADAIFTRALSGSQVSDGLDKAIDDELKHKPKDIMG